MAEAGRKNKTFARFISAVLFVVFIVPLAIERLFFFRQPRNIKKILIIELWGIGDLIMASSVFKPLRRKFPEAQIVLLSKPDAQTLFSGAGLVDTFIVFDFPWVKFQNKYSFWRWDWQGLIKVMLALRNERFDLAIDARGDVRNNLLSFLTGARSRLGYNWTGGGFFLTDAQGTFKFRHRVEAWFNLLDHMKIDRRDAGPCLEVTEKERRWQEDFYSANGVFPGDLLVGIHPGAGRETRRWPLARFVETAKYVEARYKAKVIFFEGPDEKGSSLENGYLVARPDLRQLLALIKRVDLFICNDSGPMHIAAALKRPVVAIFGPGDIERIGPYGARCYVAAAKGIKCRPCFDYCRFDKRVCLDAVGVEDVIEKINRAMEGLEYAPV